LAAVESALLVYRAVFERLKLDSVYCMTVAENLPVISFHDSCGLSRAGLLQGHFQLGDRKHDGVKHVCSRQSWPVVDQQLETQAQAIARRFQPPA
jgi:RimJ/RimL family protein N-acetyltransferase